MNKQAIGIKTAFKQQRQEGLVHLYEGMPEPFYYGVAARALGNKLPFTLAIYNNTVSHRPDEWDTSVLAFPRNILFGGQNKRIEVYADTDAEKFRSYIPESGVIVLYGFPVIALERAVYYCQYENSTTEILCINPVCSSSQDRDTLNKYEFAPRVDLHTVATTASSSNPMRPILITGNGRGKTTLGIGMSLCALNQPHCSTQLLHFLKGGKNYSEQITYEMLKREYPHRLAWGSSGRDEIIWRGRQTKEDELEVQRLISLIGEEDIKLWDEFLTTIDMEFITLQEAARLIQAHQPRYMTGRCNRFTVAEKLAKEQDCNLINLDCVRHYAELGVKLKRGVDY